MRTVALLVLMAAPLAGQAGPIAPMPSVLFVQAVNEGPGDTTLVDTGVPQGVGGILGFAAGAGIGYFLGEALFSGGEPITTTASAGMMTTASGSGWGSSGMDRTGKARLIGAAIGGVVGGIIGKHLARPHAR